MGNHTIEAAAITLSNTLSNAILVSANI